MQEEPGRIVDIKTKSSREVKSDNRNLRAHVRFARLPGTGETYSVEPMQVNSPLPTLKRTGGFGQAPNLM